MNEPSRPAEPVSQTDEINPACRDFLRTGVTAGFPFLPIARKLPEPMRSVFVQSQVQAIADKAINWGICPRDTFLECDVKPEHYEQGNQQVPSCTVSVPHYRRGPLR